MAIRKITEGTGISKRVRVTVSASDWSPEDNQAIRGFLKAAEANNSLEKRIITSEEWAHNILKNAWNDNREIIESLSIKIPEDKPYMAMMHLGGIAHDSREGYAVRIINHITLIRKYIKNNDIENTALYSLELGGMIQQCADKYQPQQKMNAENKRPSKLNNLILDIIINNQPGLSAKAISAEIEKRYANHHDSANFINSIEQGNCEWLDRKTIKITDLYNQAFDKRVSKLKTK